ncbi:MAG: trypsin-like serine protease [Oligoflexales bacterium]
MKIFLVIVMGCVLGACKLKPPKSESGAKAAADVEKDKCLGVVGGTETNEYKSVALMYGRNFCAATWVGPNAMLTLASCINDVNAPDKVSVIQGNSYDRKKGISSYSPLKPIKIVSNGLTSPTEKPKQAVGIAVLIFAGEPAPAISGLGPEFPAEGAEVSIVGYGETAYPEEGKAAEYSSPVFKKRVATNKQVYSTNAIFSGTVMVLGNPNPAPGEKSDGLLAMGDWGAPLFVGDKLVGIGGTYNRTEYADPKTAGLSQFISTNSEASKALFEEAKKQGAVFGPKPGDAPSDSTQEEDKRAKNDCQSD